jgi:hypothetical protein
LDRETDTDIKQVIEKIAYCGKHNANVLISVICAAHLSKRVNVLSMLTLTIRYKELLKTKLNTQVNNTLVNVSITGGIGRDLRILLVFIIVIKCE